MDLHLFLILLMIFVAGWCPASALSHQFHKMSTSFVQKDTHSFTHLKVSSFRPVMCLFIFALQGNERLNKSYLSLSLIFFFSRHPYEVCSTSPGMKDPQQLPSLKDGAFSLFSTLSFHIYWSLDLKGAQNLQGNFSETWELFVATKLFLKTKSTPRPLICWEDMQSGPLPWHVIPRSLTLTSFSLGSARSADVSEERAFLLTASISMTFFTASQSSGFLAHDKCFRRHWNISSSRTLVSWLFIFHICVILLFQQR